MLKYKQICVRLLTYKQKCVYLQHQTTNNNKVSKKL